MPGHKEGKGMEKKKRQQPMKEMLACYCLFLYLRVDYEDLMIWAPLAGVAIFTLTLILSTLGRYRTN